MPSLAIKLRTILGFSRYEIPGPEIIQLVAPTFKKVATPPAASDRDPVEAVPVPAYQVSVSEVIAIVTVLI